MGRKQKIRILERGQEQLTLDIDTWSEIIVVISMFGWRPNRISYSFLIRDTEVTNEEALEISSAIKRIWEEAEKDPFKISSRIASVLPTLMDVCSFCLKGGFIIR